MIYFVQCCGTGIIKVGHTAKLDGRIACLSEWAPAGLEVLVTIQGDLFREQALHYALSPFRLRREWYRPRAELWRVVLEAMDTGDLQWLPVHSGKPGPQNRVFKAAERYFGGSQNLADALGFTCPNNHRFGYKESPSFWGSFQMERAIREGAAPAYLRPEGLQCQPRRAKAA